MLTIPYALNVAQQSIACLMVSSEQPLIGCSSHSHSRTAAHDKPVCHA
jgi:hypothetical protein